MTSRINRQQATWPQPSKTKGCNKYYIVLQEACSTFSQKPAGRENEQANGVSPCSPLSLWSKLFLFLRSVITGLVPGFPFRVELVHINLEVLRHYWTDWVAFTRELTLGHIGSWPVGSLQLTCVGWGCLWRWWWWWGQVSWLWNMGPSDHGCVRPDPWILLIFLYSLHYFCIILFQHSFPH